MFIIVFGGTITTIKKTKKKFKPFRRNQTYFQIKLQQNNKENELGLLLEQKKSGKIKKLRLQDFLLLKTKNSQGQ